MVSHGTRIRPSQATLRLATLLSGLMLSGLMLSGLACGPGNEVDGDGSGAAGGQGGSGAAGGGFISGPGGAGQGGEAPEIAEVYGHSASTLYRLEPNTKEVTMVGGFQGCANVIDIALDKSSLLVATTFDGLYRIDKDTAVCTQIASGTFPNSLSFIPAGTLDPTQEALVGYAGDQYVRIDPNSGAQSFIGSPWNNGLSSSGDIVSVKGGKTYLTVKGAGCSSDCLVELNPTTGAMVKNWGPLGYTNVYGIAFWAGSVFGFSESGQLFEVTFDNQTLTTSLITQTAGTSFWGAGSTTSAPPEPTPR